MAQLMHSHQEDVIPVQVLVPDSPGLRGVKVGVPSDVGAREVGVGQEATLAIEGRAVAMEALGKEDHDVGLLLTAIADVGIVHLAEAQRCGALPHAECLANGLVCGIFAHLGGVILDAESDLIMLPFEALNGVALPSDIGLDLSPKLVWNTAAGAPHGLHGVCISLACHSQTVEPLHGSNGS